MSYTHYDPDEWESVVESRPCSCKGKCDGHCNGMVGFGMKRRDPAEVTKIKAERLRKEEDEILARAAEIQLQRGAKP